MNKYLFALVVCTCLILGGASAATATAKKGEKAAEKEQRSVCTELVFIASNTSPKQAKNLKFLVDNAEQEFSPRELADAMCAIRYGSRDPDSQNVILRAGFEFGFPCHFPCADKASEDMQQRLQEAVEKGELVVERPPSTKEATNAESEPKPTKESIEAVKS